MFLIHTSHEHADVLARAVVAACRGRAWVAPVQPRLLHVLFNQLLERDLDFETLQPISQQEVAAALVSPEERSELIQLMCAIEVLCNPVPEPMEASVRSWASALGVDDPALMFLRDLVVSEMAKAQQDFYRLNWIGDLDRKQPEFATLVARQGESAYAVTVEKDSALLKRWHGLGDCPEGSLGRRLFEFYQTRGFLMPGEPGGANVAVAQHDWVHVLADYGTTPLGEIEVVSFQASCSRSPGATLGLIGALGLFESGAFTASLIAGSHPGEALSLPGGIERMSEAMQRGRACNTDLLNFDLFTKADGPIDRVRGEFGIPPKSARVLALDPIGAASPG